MIDWDDIRIFLAVARGGSVRAAAARLTLNHSTVLRRVAQLEERLGTRLFEKLPSGYRLTGAGEEVLGSAEEMEASSKRLETQIVGRDEAVQGLLRVTMSPTIATHLLMADVAEFARTHPEVEIEILSLDQPVNLTNREADVAIRVVYDRNTLPPNLHGITGPELFGGVYVAHHLLEAWRGGACERTRWIVRTGTGAADWAHAGELLVSDIPLKVSTADAELAAVRLGMGVTTLSCFVGDTEPLLVRVPDTPLQLHGTLWLLTQGETRRTKRVRLFTEFMAGRLAAHAPLLAGRRPLVR